MAKSKYTYFKVRMAIPDGASIATAKEYIQEAVSTWHGSLRPPGAYGDYDDGDPMWELDPNSINVTLLPRTKK
jgi:hypothetical protein